MIKNWVKILSFFTIGGTVAAVPVVVEVACRSESSPQPNAKAVSFTAEVRPAEVKPISVPASVTNYFNAIKADIRESSHIGIVWEKPQTVPAELKTIKYILGDYKSSASARRALIENNPRVVDTILPTQVSEYHDVRHLWVYFEPKEGSYYESDNLIELTMSANVQLVPTRIDLVSRYLPYVKAPKLVGSFNNTSDPDVTVVEPTTLSGIIRVAYRWSNGRRISAAELADAIRVRRDLSIIVVGKIYAEYIVTDGYRYKIDAQPMQIDYTAFINKVVDTQSEDLKKVHEYLDQVQVDLEQSLHTKMVWKPITKPLPKEIKKLYYISGSVVTLVQAKAAYYRDISEEVRDFLPPFIFPSLAQRGLWAYVEGARGLFSNDNSFIDLTVSSGIRDVRTNLDVIPTRGAPFKAELIGTYDNVNPGKLELIGVYQPPRGAIAKYLWRKSWLTELELIDALNNARDLTDNELMAIRARWEIADSTRYYLTRNYEGQLQAKFTRIAKVLGNNDPIIQYLRSIRARDTAHHLMMDWEKPAQPSILRSVRFLSGNYPTLEAAKLAKDSFNLALPATIAANSEVRNLWAYIEVNDFVDPVSSWQNLTDSSGIRGVKTIINHSSEFESFAVRNMKLTGTLKLSGKHELRLKTPTNLDSFPISVTLQFLFRNVTYTSAAALETFLNEARDLKLAELRNITAFYEIVTPDIEPEPTPTQYLLTNNSFIRDQIDATAVIVETAPAPSTTTMSPAIVAYLQSIKYNTDTFSNATSTNLATLVKPKEIFWISFLTGNYPTLESAMADRKKAGQAPAKSLSGVVTNRFLWAIVTPYGKPYQNNIGWVDLTTSSLIRNVKVNLNDIYESFTTLNLASDVTINGEFNNSALQGRWFAISQPELPTGADVVYSYSDSEWLQREELIGALEGDDTLTGTTLSTLRAKVQSEDEAVYILAKNYEAKIDIGLVRQVVPIPAEVDTFSEQFLANKTTSRYNDVKWTAPTKLPAQVESIRFVSGDYPSADLPQYVIDGASPDLPLVIEQDFSKRHLYMIVNPIPGVYWPREERIYDLTETSGLLDIDVPAANKIPLPKSVLDLIKSSIKVTSDSKGVFTWTLPSGLPSNVGKITYWLTTYTLQSQVKANLAQFKATPPSSVEIQSSKRHLWVHVSPAPGYSFTNEADLLFEVTNTSGILAVKILIDALPTFSKVDLTKLRLTTFLNRITISTRRVSLPAGTKIVYRYPETSTTELTKTQLEALIRTFDSKKLKEELAKVRAYLQVTDSKLYILNNNKEVPLPTLGFTF